MHNIFQSKNLIETGKMLTGSEFNRGGKIQSPVGMTPTSYLLNRVPNTNNPIDPSRYAKYAVSPWNRWFGGWSNPSKQAYIEPFPHFGVGEKGPASRFLANSLGTYKDHSTIDPIKAAIYATNKKVIQRNLGLLSGLEKRAYAAILRDTPELGSTRIYRTVSAKKFGGMFALEKELIDDEWGTYITKPGINLPSGKWSALEHLTKEDNPFIHKRVERAFGVTKSTEEQLKVFTLIHEFGHAKDTLNKSHEELQQIETVANNLNKSIEKKARDRYSITKLSEWKTLQSYPDGGLELFKSNLEEYKRLANAITSFQSSKEEKIFIWSGAAYRNNSRERFADNYAKKIIRGLIPHAGPGEKGPASKAIVEALGTYQEHSRVDVLKAAIYASSKHYHDERQRQKNFGNVFLAATFARYALPAFTESHKMGDGLTSSLLAGSFGGLSKIPNLMLMSRVGQGIGGAFDWATGRSSSSDFVRSLGGVSQELLSFHVSKYLGMQALRNQTTREAGIKLLEFGSKTFGKVGEHLDSAWFRNKSGNFGEDAKILKEAGIGTLSKDIATLLGGHGGISTVFQEIIDVGTTWLAGLGTHYVANKIADRMEDSKRRSHRHAYKHAGVGEKGPHSRHLANQLGTYRDQSTIDPIKAALYAINSGTIKKNLAKLSPLVKRVYAAALREAPHLGSVPIVKSFQNEPTLFRSQVMGDSYRAWVELTGKTISKEDNAFYHRIKEAWGTQKIHDQHELAFTLAHELGHANDFIHLETRSIVTKGEAEAARIRNLDLDFPTKQSLYRKLPSESRADSFATKVINGIIPHTSVGEKGPASNILKHSLKTFNNESTVNIMKAAIMAEVDLAARKKTGAMFKLSIDKLYENVASKYNITKDEFSRWVSNNNLSNKLRKRGVSTKEFEAELRHANNSLCGSERAFLTKTEKLQNAKLDSRQTHSLLSAKEYSNRIAFDNMIPKIPEIYGKTKSAITPKDNIKIYKEPQLYTMEASNEGGVVIESKEPIVTPTMKSNVNIMVRDGDIDYKRLDKILTTSLKK